MRLTDAGNAERLIEKYGDDVLYCPPMKCWYIWDGRVWREDTNNGIYQLAKEVARSYLTDLNDMDRDDHMYPRVARWSATSESLHGIKAMTDIAQSNHSTSISPSHFDRDPMLLNVENGTVDLTTGKLHKYDPSNYITKIAPITYRIGAGCPVWEGFIADVLPDPATREYIQAAVGYSMTASMKEEHMFILHGGGGNGKTTFINTILNLMGDYGAQASSYTLMRKRDGGARDDLFVLMGKRFVAATETGESHHLDENLVKQMTGGNKVSINPKYRSQIEFYPTWKLWLDTNYEPMITGTDAAIWRRLIKIPFEVTISKSKCDKDLKSYLMTDLDERSGILNWALTGVKLWNSNHLYLPTNIQNATSQYRADQDLTGQFLSEVCKVCHISHQSVTPKDVIYDEYLVYCRKLNETPKSKQAFGHDLLQRGIKESRSNSNRYWVGVSIDQRVSFLPCDAV